MIPGPRQLVEAKFKELYGTLRGVRVTGSRAGGTYRTAVVVGGHTVASAEAKKWRSAYRLLRLELERGYALGD